MAPTPAHAGAPSTSSLQGTQPYQQQQNGHQGQQQQALFGQSPAHTGVPPPHIRIQTSAAACADGVSAWRLAQLCIVYGAILAHVFVMAYTDPLQDSSFVMLLLLFSVQLTLLLAILLAFFLLTSHSPCVRLGMYARYFQQYRGFYMTALLAIFSFAGVGVYRLALSHSNTPPLLVWQQPAFHPLWVVERTCLLAFQCAAARAAALSLRPPSEPWLAAALQAWGSGEQVELPPQGAVFDGSDVMAQSNDDNCYKR